MKKSPIHEMWYSLIREGEEIEVRVEYSVSSYDPGNTYGLPENCYPPEGGEIEELGAFLSNGSEINLTSAEEQALEPYIQAHHNYDYEEDDY